MARLNLDKKAPVLKYIGYSVGIVAVIIIIIMIVLVFKKPKWNESQKTGFYQYLQVMNQGKLSQECLKCAVPLCASKYSYTNAVNPINFDAITAYIKGVCPSCNEVK